MANKYCDNCGCAVGRLGCENCNEESYIVEQYYDQGMPLPDENTDFMKKYHEQQKNQDEKGNIE